MKKIVYSIASILIVGSFAIGATRAWFTNQKTISGNTMSTGTLNVSLIGDATSTYDLGTMVLEPGKETDWASIDIVNDGTMNLGWFGYFNFSGNLELLNKIYIKDAKMEFLKPDNATTWEPIDQFITNGVGSGTYPGTYNDLAAWSLTNYGVNKVTLKSWQEAPASNGMGVGLGLNTGALKPGYKYRLSFRFALDESADNFYQGKSLSNSYTVVATQIMADALAAVDAGNDRVSIAAPSSIATWMTQQINKQNP